MERIDVLGAMDEELAGLRLSALRATALAAQSWSDMIAVERTGVGKVNATLAVARVHGRGTRGIISVGTAGALTPGLTIGDVVIVDRAVQHDVDASPVGFPRGTIPFEPTSEWRADTELVRLAAHAAHACGYPTAVGSICSGERFIADDAEKLWLRKHFGGACTDMETGAIAQACAKLDIPWVGIRVISDGADHEAAVDFAASLALASDRIAHIVSGLFTNPR